MIQKEPSQKDNRLLIFAQRVLPNRASKFAPGIFTQPQLLACLLIKEYLHLDYRATEALLSLSDGLSEALSLSRVPDHSMLWWFMRHRLTAEIVQNALKETVRRVEPAAPPREGNSLSDPPRREVALVMSVTKRKLGEALLARRDEMQERQALLRGVVYNVHRLAIFGWLWLRRSISFQSILAA